MVDFGERLSWFVKISQSNMHYALIVILGLWIIQIFNFLMNYKLNGLGLRPRTCFGFLGIFLSPFLHGDFKHLFFNSIPLFILMLLMLFNGFTHFIVISFLIIFLGGIGVWLLGRNALHVGASGVIMGYWGYLLLDSIMNPSILSIFLVIICFYYFAAFFSSLIPKAGTSWEGHFFGFLAGLFINYMHLSTYFLRIL